MKPSMPGGLGSVGRSVEEEGEEGEGWKLLE